MKIEKLVYRLLFAMIVIFVFFEYSAAQTNLVSTQAGARIARFSSNYEGLWDVANLIGGVENWTEELPAWCTAQNAPFPHWAVIELPAQTWFTTLIFNNFIPDEAAGWIGISAKDVQIQISSVSDSTDFKTVASFQLERNKNNQEVRLEPTQGRWLKIVITSNWGHEEYTELGKLGVFDDGGRPSDIAKELKAKGYVDVYGIYFDFASANLKPESSPILSKIATYLKTKGSSRLVIEGHTDNIGDPKKNQTLSEDRSKSVVVELVKLGVAQTQLQAMGYGAIKPVGDNKTITGRAKNRRVTLRVMN